MTNDEINKLIARRNQITSKQHIRFYNELDRIDDKLRTVPAGTRNDVDLLLGRPTKRVVLVQHADGTQDIDPAFGPQQAPQDYRIANRPGNPNWRGVAAWLDEAAGLTPQDIADMQARCAETDSETVLDWRDMRGDLAI